MVKRTLEGRFICQARAAVDADALPLSAVPANSGMHGSTGKHMALLAGTLRSASRGASSKDKIALKSVWNQVCGKSHLTLPAAKTLWKEGTVARVIRRARRGESFLAKRGRPAGYRKCPAEQVVEVLSAATWQGTFCECRQ